MSNRRRLLPTLFGTGAATVIFVVVRLFLHYTAPPPRWDLAVPLAVGVLSLAGALAVLRCGRITTRGGGQTSRYWWMSQRAALAWIGGFFVPFAAFMVAGASLSYSPGAWQIREAGAVIRQLQVQDVLESDWRKSGKVSYYMVRARVDVPYESGVRSRIDEFRSEAQVDAGDGVWVLYAPTSPELGASLGATRGELDEQIGGGASWYSYLGLVPVAFLSSFFVRMLFSRPSATLAKQGKRGTVRAAGFTVTGGGVQREAGGKGGDSIVPVLHLRCAGGKATLRLDGLVDPVDAANLLMGKDVTLYWAAPEPQQRSQRILAVLVTGDARCLYGSVKAEGEGLPEGTLVPAGKHLPQGASLRSIRTSPVWDPGIYTVGVRWLLIGMLGLLVAASGVNVLLSVMGGIAAGSSTYLACSAVKRKRQAYLKSLAPDAPLPEVPA